MLEMMIWTIFAIVSMMRIIGVEILKKWICAEQTAHSKSLKTRSMLYTLCAMSEMMIWTVFAIVNMMRITGVVISKKVKMSPTNSNFEKVQNTLNLIYTVCVISEMMI